MSHLPIFLRLTFNSSGFYLAKIPVYYPGFIEYCCFRSKSLDSSTKKNSAFDGYSWSFHDNGFPPLWGVPI